MALWLCRRRAEDQPDVALARRLGVGAWVVSVDLLGAGFVAELSSQQDLPVLLEWRLRQPLAVDQEPEVAQRWAAWCRKAKAWRWQGRPLLILHGTEWLSHPRHAGQRLKAAFEAALGEPIWLLQRADASSPGFDGVCEAVELPLPAEASADRANYEVHLRDAHWRQAPIIWTIPAVRPLPAGHQDRYANASSRHYCDWLQLASHWSALQCEGAADAPVLIESWAGHCLWWQAGIKLDPDPPLALDGPPRLHQWGTPTPDHLAVLVHGYYLDALAQMLEDLPREGLDLYVSTPLRQLPAAAALLRQQHWPRVQLFGVPNRGRDLAPFLLDLLPAAQAVGYRSFIKLHTKSSPHLSDGEDWGSHLLGSLLDPAVLQRLQRDPPQGLLAPAGTVVPITLQLQNNGAHLVQLQRRFGVSGRELLGAQFIAGSMFAGGLALLRPLLGLGLQRCDFEPENGQTDGTLAHALERWIGVVAKAIEELPGNTTAMPGFGFRWSDHPQGMPESNHPASASLPDSPLIDSPQFIAHRQRGDFGDFDAIADQLNSQGFALVDLGRERMAAMAQRIRSDLKGAFDLEAWRNQGGHQSLRVQDAWQTSEAVRELALLPEIHNALQICWGRTPFAFQTLNFPVGTQQHLHSDAVHFHSEPPGFMCGVWVALEDIDADAGPLEYVPGSQRLPYLQAADVGVRQQEGVTPDQSIFHDYWSTVVSEGNFQRELFTPRLGQALIWTANLIHGGSAVENLQRTRWSQVTHYFFEGCRHYTPMLSDWPDGPVAWRNPFDIAAGTERSTSDRDLNLGHHAAVQHLSTLHGWRLQHLSEDVVSAKAFETAVLKEAIASRDGDSAAFSLALMEWALAVGYSSPWLQDNRARALVHLDRVEEACELWSALAEPPHEPALRSMAVDMLQRYSEPAVLETALQRADFDAVDRLLDRLLAQGQTHGPRDWQPLVARMDASGLMPLLLPLLEARIDTHPSQGLFRLIDGLRALRGAVHLDQLLRVSGEVLLAFGWRDRAGPLVLMARTSLGRWLNILSCGVDLSRPDVAEQLGLTASTDLGFMAQVNLEPGESLSQLWIGGHQQNLDVRDLRGYPYVGVVDQLLQACQPGLTPVERAPALFDAGVGSALQELSTLLKEQEHWRTLIKQRHRFGREAPEADITVVIPLYRRWDFILGHVAGFSQDSWFIEQRVRLLYVVDDPTIETEMLGWCRGQLRDELLDVTVVTLHRNSGFAIACNTGVLAAETSVVCLLNSDVLPIQPGWMQPLFRTMLMMPGSLLAPLLLTDEGQIQHGGMEMKPMGVQGLPACVHLLKGLDVEQIEQLSPDGLPYDVDLLSGAALVFERDRFLGLGGFNPVFGRGDFEDLDLSRRWQQSGGRLQVVPSARLMHLERQSITHAVGPLTQWRAVLNAWQAQQLQQDAS